MTGFGTTQHINTGHNDNAENYAPHQLSNISAIDLKKTFMDWENGSSNSLLKTSIKVVKFVQPFE